MVSEIKILGTTDEVTTCECCGRDDLKHTVAIERDGAGTSYFGVVCAARIYGMERSAIRKAASAADNAARRAADTVRRARAEAEAAEWFTWLSEHGTGATASERIASLGGFTAAHAAYRSRQKRPAETGKGMERAARSGGPDGFGPVHAHEGARLRAIPSPVPGTGPERHR